MRVSDAVDLPSGTRIEVTRVAAGEAEALGYVDDSSRLTGQRGTIKALHSAGTALAQLEVDWDDARAGSLFLSGADEFVVVADVSAEPKRGPT